MSKPTTAPGKTPAINRPATDTFPATTAYRIMMLLGGIRRPVVAEVVVNATLNGFDYPLSSISGIMKPPIDEPAAPADPETAPKSMHVSVFT